VQQSLLAGRAPLAAPAIPNLLLRAAATSASAVVRPVAGEVDAALRAEFLTSATVERTSHAL
ncbi:MAG: hypothetical protein L0L69_10575, partial [Propionibacterium sp.]|nr:hypothetical protein [Propionibacterium sp.]